MRVDGGRFCGGFVGEGAGRKSFTSAISTIVTYWPTKSAGNVVAGADLPERSTSNMIVSNVEVIQRKADAAPT